MSRCHCGGVLISIENEVVCERCGCIIAQEKYNTDIYSSKNFGLGSWVGRDASKDKIFGNYMRKYSNIFLRSKEEKAEYRLKGLAERVENLFGLPSYLREDAIKLLLKRTSARSIGALAYAYVMAARARGNWAISWHTVHRKLKEMGIKADIEEMVEYGKMPKYTNYIPRVAEKVAYAFKGRLSSLGKNPHTYFNTLISQCEKLLSKIDKTRFDGHSPFSIAVTAVYISEHELARKESRKPIFTQAELASLTGISIYTIRETGSLIRRLISDHALGPESVIKAKV